MNIPSAHAVSGMALHSGIPSTISVTRRAEDNRGLRLYWPGFDGPLEAKDLVGLHRTARRATVLEYGAPGEKQAVMRTPEHLLAAALFFAEAPLDIRCDTVEPPGLDGSALPFYRLLADASGIAPRAGEYGSELQWEHDGPEGFLRAAPQNHFSVEYLWEDGEVRQHFDLRSAADAPDQVLAARTFIAYRDWKELFGRRDLLAGAGADSGLLVAASVAEYADARNNMPELRGKTFPLLHPESFRLKDELARHKVLDLLGDLALNGLALPKLRLTIRNGGHALNHLLLNQLQQERLHHE